MTVVRIDALCACEGCGKRFGVELELATEIKGSAFDDFEGLAREEILSGNATCYTWGVRGKATVDRMSLSCHPTIQAELMLCDICTAKCDAVEVPEDRNLTRAEVNRALGLPAETT